MSASQIIVTDPGFTILHLDTVNRDTVTYSDSNSCLLELEGGIDLTEITNVKLGNCELANVGYAIVKPTIYYSECIEQVWYPFKGFGISGNHNLTSMVECLDKGFSNSLLLSGTNDVTHKNTYAVTYSYDEFGRMFIQSDGVVPYNIHLRTQNVKVLTATIDDSDISIMHIVLSDSSLYPLLPGAYCKLLFPTIPSINNEYVVVQSTSTSSTLTIIQATNNTTAWSTLFSLGESISLSDSVSSYLCPESANNNVLAEKVGFGKKVDVSGQTTVPLLMAVSPFYNSTEDATLTFECTTSEPIAPLLGEYARITNTGYFIDGIDLAITSVTSNNVFTVQATTSDYLSDFLDFTVGEVTLVGNISGSTYTLQSIEFSSIYNNVIKIEFQLNTTVPNASDFVEGDTFTLFNMNTPEMNIMEFTVTDTAAVIDGSDMTIEGSSSYSSVGFTDGEVSILNASQGTSEDGDYTRIPNKIVSPYHYDFTSSNRVIFMELKLNDTQAIGHIYTPTIPGKRLFSRIGFSAGSNTIHFLEGMAIVDEVLMETPVSRISSIYVSLYTPDGELYDTNGLDFSFSLIFKKKIVKTGRQVEVETPQISSVTQPTPYYGDLDFTDLDLRFNIT